MFDFIFCHFLKNFKEKISKPMNEHNIPCFIRNIKILTVLVGIKSVISSLSVQIQVVHCFQINSVVNKASFFFFKINLKLMVNLYILLLYIYLVYALSYFFLWKNANNMCNWCCPREEKIWMFCFYSLLVMYIHCGLLKEYTAYSIFKIPLLIILVLNHWFNFFFLKTIPMSFWCSFLKLKPKTYLFKLFFILEIYSQSYIFRDMTFNFERCCDLDLSFTFHSIWSCPL